MFIISYLYYEKSVLNIFNNINLNLNLKKKSFATVF